MKKITLLLLLIISCNSYSQKLACKDFKEGTFIIPKSSVNPFITKVIRKGNLQIESIINLHEIDEEIITKFPELKNKIYVTLNWINNCSYIMKYDKTKMKLDKTTRELNNKGGVLTELIKIEGKCFYYKSTMTVNNKVERLDGKLCKK